MRKLIALVGLGAVFTLAAGLGGEAEAQPANPDQQPGVEVMARGPMHEAYATPQSLNPLPMPIVPKAPPAPVPELPPDQKPAGNHVVWINGYWAWDDEPASFIWISGFWRDVPPGKRWVPGHWAAAAGGFQWSPGLWLDEQQTAVNYLPPPPPSVETGPSIAAPAVDQFYNPGSWVYVQQQYRWRPGFWLKYRPNWVYVPAHYVSTPAGCIFVDGHWDYELTRRGLLFCPVRFTANVFTQIGWRLRHQFIVYPEVIVSALFVRIEYGRYCFGDYFGANFVKHGFVPWVDYRLYKNIPEPLFHQYAWNHRTDVNWERDLRKLYDDRRVGIALRPPHTIVQQQQFLRDLAEHKAITVGGKTFAFKDAKLAERNLAMVNTLAKVDRNVVPLRQITPAAHAEVMKTVDHLNAVRVERKTTAINIMNQKPSTGNVVGKLPALPQHLQTPATVIRPMNTVIPNHVERVIPKFTPPTPPKASTKPLPRGAVRQPPTSWLVRLDPQPTLDVGRSGPCTAAGIRPRRKEESRAMASSTLACAAG